MKQIQQVTEKEYIKAGLKLLSAAVNKPRHIIKQIDSYFFCEEDEEIKPYFYGSISFIVAVVLFVYVTII